MVEQAGFFIYGQAMRSTVVEEGFWLRVEVNGWYGIDGMVVVEGRLLIKDTLRRYFIMGWCCGGGG